MTTLSKDEILNLKGGALKLGVIGLVTGIITFIIGVIDGITNPKRCTKWKNWMIKKWNKLKEGL